ncbi:MAG TPA: ATP-binding protein, partial [Solirubrobacteraceae bacterium]
MQRVAQISVELDSTPGCVTLVRAMLSATSETLGFAPELLDDLKTAVSEACNNVVVHAYEGGVGPLTVALDVRDGTVEVVIRDQGKGIQQLTPSEERMGVGLAVMSALSDRVEFTGASGGGTEVRLEFSGRSFERAVSSEEPAPALGELPGSDELPDQSLSGYISVTLTPVGLLAGVMGRVARALAASTSFSFDRFSDIYLISDAIAAHAERAASAGWISFALDADDGKLELSVGPLRSGSGVRLEEEAGPAHPRSPLGILVDELIVERGEQAETLRVVLGDRRDEAVG